VANNITVKPKTEAELFTVRLFYLSYFIRDYHAEAARNDEKQIRYL